MDDQRVRREGKAPVGPGDEVTVASADLTVRGVTFRDRGWKGRLIRIEDGLGIVEQSRRGRYGYAGVRAVPLSRITRRYR